MNKKVIYFIGLILLSGCSYFNKKEYNILENINELDKYISKNNLFVFDTSSTSLHYFLQDNENKQVPINIDSLIKFTSENLLNKNQDSLLDLIFSKNINTNQKDNVIKFFNKFIKTKVENHFFDPNGFYKNLIVKSTKPEVVEFIKKVQNSDAKIMILTAKPWDIRLVTEQQLGEIDINMSINPIYNQELIQNKGNIQSDFGYQNGILYLLKYPGTDEKTNKGSILVSFLEKINYKPEKIIYIDSSLNNILDAKNILNEKNIEYIIFWNKGYIEDKTLEPETLSFIEKVLGPDWNKIEIDLNEAVNYILEKLK